MLNGGGSIALVCLDGRVHIASVQADVLAVNSVAICGDELEGSREIAYVDTGDLPHLHTFTICPRCTTAYLRSGYRERVLAALPDQPADVSPQAALEAMYVSHNQLTLF